jgi:hypothetical protein
VKKLPEFKLDLIAQMFNPDKLIHQVAAWSLCQMSRDEYDKNVKRLGEQLRREMDDVVVSSEMMSSFEKVLFFEKIDVFKDIPGITLTYLGDMSEELTLEDGQTMVLDETMNNDFLVITSGRVDFFQKGEQVGRFEEGQFVGEMVALPHFVNTNLIIAKETTRILRFNKDKFYELLTDNVKLAGKILEFA